MRLEGSLLKQPSGEASNMFFYVHPENWGRWTHFGRYFFFRWVETELKPPTSNLTYLQLVEKHKNWGRSGFVVVCSAFLLFTFFQGWDVSKEKVKAWMNMIDVVFFYCFISLLSLENSLTWIDGMNGRRPWWWMVLWTFDVQRMGNQLVDIYGCFRK